MCFKCLEKEEGNVTVVCVEKEVLKKLIFTTHC